MQQQGEFGTDDNGEEPKDASHRKEAQEKAQRRGVNSGKV